MSAIANTLVSFIALHRFALYSPSYALSMPPLPSSPTAPLHIYKHLYTILRMHPPVVRTGAMMSACVMYCSNMPPANHQDWPPRGCTIPSALNTSLATTPSICRVLQ